MRLPADLGAAARRAVDDEAARLRAWLGETRVTLRLRTPPERELSR
ncbi:MAG: hypothetical protein Q8O56_00410 [Solirubrobacteraceae bacterium]|nr:hypothetical protein [Solirubrobacteraceae bacterium]